MTAPAQRDVDRRPVHARAAVVHDERLRVQPLVGEAGLAAAVPSEDGVAVAGKVKERNGGAGHNRRGSSRRRRAPAATGPAPPGRLSFP